MELTPDGEYRFSYSLEGKLICANRVKDGATVYVADSPHYTTETNPLTRAFLAHGYDLSDRSDLNYSQLFSTATQNRFLIVGEE